MSQEKETKLSLRQETGISLKKIFSWISIEEFVLCLYILFIVTQGHPTWEGIIDIVTMQTVQ